MDYIIHEKKQEKKILIEFIAKTKQWTWDYNYDRRGFESEWVPLDDVGDVDAEIGPITEELLDLVAALITEDHANIGYSRLAQVLNVDFPDAECLGLLPCRLHFLALADIGREGHDLTAVGFLKPLYDYRGIEPARIGQYDLVDV